MSFADQFLVQHKGLRDSKDTSDWGHKRAILVESCHPKQRIFAKDKGRYVAALVGGRGGKTTGSKARILDRMMGTPNARVRYFATTRAHAEDLMWVPLKETCAALGIRADWNETKLCMHLPQNGARLWLVGCDNKRDAERHRGLPSHEVIIDEAGSFDPKLIGYLIDQVIAPRLGDYRGTLVLIGTPAPLQAGRFWEVTEPNSDLSMHWSDPDRTDSWDGWNLHTWSLQDGASYVKEMANAWELALHTKKINGWEDSHPVWRREYLGQWAADNSENIYRYNVERNQWDPDRVGPYQIAKLPDDREWLYVFGCDLGHGDEFAECVFAFEPHSKELLHVAEFGAREMYPKRIAEHLLGESLNAENPEGMLRWTGWPVGHVADSEGLGQGYLDELRDVYGVPIKKAEKKDKLGAIELFNGDLDESRIKILKGSKLEQQLMALQWNMDDYGRLREKKGDKNDYTDAALYARREAHHQFGAPAPAKPPEWGTPEATEKALADAEARLDKAEQEDDDELSWDDFPDDEW